jgi:hypothetical protein
MKSAKNWFEAGTDEGETIQKVYRRTDPNRYMSIL